MKITFAIYLANRGFFPGEVIASAAKEMKEAIEDAGYSYICMDENETRYGAVETREEGKKFAEFLQNHKNEYHGIILCMPNFGDENGAIAALKDTNVPILVQAYPDELGKMDFAHRRDAMCGKFAMCNLLRQANIKFTMTKDFVVSPKDEAFKKDLEYFASICRIVNGMKNLNMGCIGARTTAFKTVRLDEIAFQRRGINIETIDLSEVFSRIKSISNNIIEEKKKEILMVSDFKSYPEEKLTKIAALQAVLEDLAKEYQLNAMAIRCWPEFETELAIAPCTNVGLLNEKGIPTACETDITNAVMMYAVALAANRPTTLLDFNNNYGNNKNKSIFFHCGPVPISLTEGKGEMTEHLMFKKSYGEGSGVGVNKSKIKSGEITFGSLLTDEGKIKAFVSNGKFTDDEFDTAFFGSGKVVEKENIYDICNYMALNGYKHHVCVTFGDYAEAIKEAFEKYLDIETKLF